MSDGKRWQEWVVPARMWPDDNVEATDPETGEKLTFDKVVCRRATKYVDEYIARGLQGLSPRHRDASDAFWGAWYLGGLERSAIGSYDGVWVDSGDPHWITPTTEARAFHRLRYREMRASVGRRLGDVLERSVVDDWPAVDIGRSLCGLRDKTASAAAGLALIYAALDSLADYLDIKG